MSREIVLIEFGSKVTSAKLPDKGFRRNVLTFVPGYGLTCSGQVTNGDWGQALCWLLWELGYAVAYHAREGLVHTLDTAGVPQEILDNAKQYEEADGIYPRQAVVTACFLTIKKLIESHGYVYSEKRREYVLAPTSEETPNAE